MQLVMAKDKINEATNVASSRSRGKNKTVLKPKETEGTAQELPEWAKDLPDEIVVKTWEID